MRLTPEDIERIEAHPSGVKLTLKKYIEDISEVERSHILDLDALLVDALLVASIPFRRGGSSERCKEKAHEIVALLSMTGGRVDERPENVEREIAEALIKRDLEWNAVCDEVRASERRIAQGAK